MRSRKLFYYAFLALLWAPLLATLVSPQARPFARSVLADPKAFDAELNRLRQAIPQRARSIEEQLSRLKK